MSDEVRLDEVMRRAQTRVDKDNTDLIYYVGGEHFDSAEMDLNGRGLIEGSTIGPMFYYGFKPGDFLLVSRNPHLMKASRVDFAGICSEKTFVLESIDPGVLDPDFLPWVLQNEIFWTYAFENRHGSTNTFLNWSDLAAYTFALPNIERQRELAELLWSAQDVKRYYKRLLQVTDDIVKSRFVEMFGSADFDNVPIADICDLFCDGDWIESKDQDETGTIRLVQTGNVGSGKYLDKEARARHINEETYERLNCTEIFPGDVLVSRLPNPVGRACVLPDGLGKSITAVDCSILRLKSYILPCYFVAFTMTSMYESEVAKYVTGSTRKRISRKSLSRIAVPLPPIELQQEFADFVSQVDKSRSALQQALDDLNATMTAILNEELSA